MIVEVEIALVRRDPRKSPAHASLESLQICQRRARDRHQRHIVLREVLIRSVDVVAQERATNAAFTKFPPPHEVINNQLASPLEQLSQSLLSGDRIEDIFLVDPHPGQRASRLTYCVACPRQLLFFCQKRCPRGQPFGFRNDRVVFNQAGCHRNSSPGCSLENSLTALACPLLVASHVWIEPSSQPPGRGSP